MDRSIWIGFDPREAAAFAVARRSIKRWLSQPIPVHGVVLDDLRAAGIYWRPTERRDGVLWDKISGAPMSTEFACSRFFVPQLAKRGWALFLDCDMLVLDDLVRLFEMAEQTDKALLCVQHEHKVTEGAPKMDGQRQVNYARKNWSSVMMLNCNHPSNRKLTLEELNTLPGRDLHRFFWLDDDEIGALNPAWNVLVGHSEPGPAPRVLHFTDGLPVMAGYENTPFADLWSSALKEWAR